MTCNSKRSFLPKNLNSKRTSSVVTYPKCCFLTNLKFKADCLHSWPPHGPPSAIMLRRPWPPVYRHPGSGGGLGPPGPGGPYHTFFPFRPDFPRSPLDFYSTPHKDFFHHNAPHKDFFHHKMSKGEYYFLAPLYRNVLPPPPPPAPLKPLPRRIMPMPPLDLARRSNSQPPCTCAVPPRLKSRSLENLNNVIIDSQEDDYPSSRDYRDSAGQRDKENLRRSMENLLDVNNNSSMAPLFKKPAKKVREENPLWELEDIA